MHLAIASNALPPRTEGHKPKRYTTPDRHALPCYPKQRKTSAAKQKKNVTRQMFSVVLLQSSTTGGGGGTWHSSWCPPYFYAMGCSVWLRYDSGCFVLKLASYGSFLLCSLSALRNSRWKSTPAVVSPKGMPHHTPTAPKPKRKAKA